MTALVSGMLMMTAPAAAQLSNLGATPVATGQLSVAHGLAYAARHDVYLMAYESPGGVQGRFVNASGATVGSAFTIAGLSGVAYVNKPMVAYSNDSTDDVFFVMFATDRGKQYDGPPSAYIQRVTFTGSGGALVGSPFLASDGVYELPNDLIYNPVTKKFVAVWERIFSEGADVLLRFFNANGTASGNIVNVSNANWSQGAAKAAIDWETNRIMIAYQGVSPTSPPSPEVLGLWAKIVDGTTGALLTGLLTVQNGFTIEPVPVFVPERDGFVVAWTGFTPGRDVQGRFVSSADGAVGAMPANVYTIAGSGRQEGAAMGMYDAISRRVLMAVQSSGGCPNDACPYLDGAVLDGQGAVLSVFTGLSTATPRTNGGGTFYPDVAVGEGGQFGFSYTLDYSADYVERVSLPAAATPGPIFGGGNTVALSPASLSFSVTKTGSAIGGFSAQSTTVTFSSGPLAWTATTSTPWLQVTGGSGNGNGSFSVTVINPGDVIGSQTSLSGSVTLTAAGASNSPLTLTITATVALQQPVFLNNDGLADVFSYQASTGDWARQITHGGGGFSESPGAWAPGWSILPATFNADALTDLFVYSATTGQWYQMLNTGSGFSVQATGTWWPGWQKFVTDLDGDGLSDLFLYDLASGVWYRALATPGGFTYTSGIWNPGWEITPIRLNGDAFGDLFLMDRATGRWFWVTGQANGSFAYPAMGYWQTDWAFYPGDFNGDGLGDWFLYRAQAGQYYVALNTGAGYTYANGAGWAAGWTPMVVDWNADGRSDLLLYNKTTTGQWYQLQGNGAGQFAVVGSGWWNPEWDLSPTDFNADGRTDLLLYKPGTGEWFQAWNLTTGTFTYLGGVWKTGLTLVVGLLNR